MLVASLLIVIGLVFLALGAEGLVRAGSSLALRLGVTPLVIGLTIVAMGTSSPELVVSVEASLKGNGAISLGNVIGSNIGNIALILAVAALVCPIKVASEVVRREVPVMIGVSALMCLLIADGELGRLDGTLLLCGSFIYTFFVYYIARRSKSRLVQEEFAEAIGAPSRAAWLDGVLLLGGLALLIGGAQMLVNGALTIADYFAISPVVVGLTVVAIGTALPELATAIVAARKGEPDVALGNVIGSNTLNILLILGVAACLQPLSAAQIRPLDLAAMLGSAIVLFALVRWRAVLDRPGAILLLIGYAAYLYSLFR